MPEKALHYGISALLPEPVDPAQGLVLQVRAAGPAAFSSSRCAAAAAPPRRHGPWGISTYFSLASYSSPLPALALTHSACSPARTRSLT